MDYRVLRLETGLQHILTAQLQSLCTGIMKIPSPSTSWRSTQISGVQCDIAAAHHHTDAIRACCTSHNLPKINKTSQLQCEWHTQMWSLQWMIFYAVRCAYIRRPAVQLWLFPDVLSVFIQFVCSHVSFRLNIFVWYGSSTPSWNELQTVVQSYSCLLTHLRPYISLDTLSQKTQQVM